MFSNAPASLLITGTTASPSFTGSVPPVTKQFCTSMTRSALFASGLIVASACTTRAPAIESKPAAPTPWTNCLRCIFIGFLRAVACCPCSDRAAPAASGRTTLALPIELRNLVSPQSANAGVRPRAGRHRDHEQHLVGPRRVGDAHLDGVEMAAHISRDAVVDRDVDRTAHSTDLGRRRHDRMRALEQVAHAVAAGDVPERAVLELAGD